MRVGGQHDVASGLTLMADLEWTRWSAVDAVDVVSRASDGAIDTLVFDWRDTLAGSVGVRWRATPRWTLNAGFMYEPSPTRDATREPRVPDTDRMTFAGGAKYALTSSVDLVGTYQYVDFSRDTIALSARDDPAAGGLAAEIDAAAHIVAFSASVRF